MKDINKVLGNAIEDFLFLGKRTKLYYDLDHDLIGHVAASFIYDHLDQVDFRCDMTHQQVQHALYGRAFNI